MRAVVKIRLGRFRATWCRRVRQRNAKPPSQDDFRAPGEDQEWPISEGRFKHSRQAHWYLTDGDSTAIAEVLDSGAGIVWTQEFEIEPCPKVLDVSRSIEGYDASPNVQNIEVALALVMMGALDGYVDRNRAWKPGYLVSQFVMDAAKLAGFEGIRYRSVRALHGENLMLFRRVAEPRRHVEEDAPDFLGGQFKSSN